MRAKEPKKEEDDDWRREKRLTAQPKTGHINVLQEGMTGEPLWPFAEAGPGIKAARWRSKAS